MSVWSAVIFICISFMDLGITLAKHGEPQQPHDFGTTLVAVCIVFTVLYWGGFFAPLFSKLGN